MLAFALCGATVAEPAPEIALVPQPQTLTTVACRRPPDLGRGLVVDPSIDAGGRELLDERLRAAGLPPTRPTANGNAPTVALARDATLAHEAYRLRVDDRGVRIAAGDADGAFDALATLAQLFRKRDRAWQLPCVAIADAPAMAERIVSDDVSRGPLPTLAYFEERIRGLAALKINGYSPYMEQVFVDPRAPYVANANGITAGELRALTTYARRFHVTLIPEQQTFAHMHETLKWETFAPLAELPHGYLLAPSDPGTYAYLEPLLRAERAAVGNVPYFHVGSDEPLDLGRGRSTEATTKAGVSQAFAAHVNRVAALVAPARPMIWDDAIQRDPSVMAALPKNLVVVDFHYGRERSYAGYIATVAKGGFAQLVSPSAANFNELYPDLDLAFDNIAGFVADGKAANVLGMFMTVWHDDGETLYDTTWAPLAFAAATAWQRGPVDRTRFGAAFARAFFATDDMRYADDLAALARLRSLLRTSVESDPGNYLFWADPFDERIGARVRKELDLRAIRLAAEGILAHLDGAPPPPMHPNAASEMALAALQYDALARRFQIGAEARAYYDDARAHADGKSDGIVYRGLNVAKYLCWEMRDAMLDIAPRYRAAWAHESGPDTYAGERALARFASDAERSVRRADRLNVVQREDYLRSHIIPTFDEVLARP